MKKNNFFYYFISISGILIFSIGLCIFGESVIKKLNQENWFLFGTIALVLINAGICIMISSIEYKK
tara:strand:- start:1606 stop:1803 length:198 start_codon:yes stop_codon:yes gene_type:complete